MLTENWREVELVAQTLLDHETINAEQFEALMLGEDPFEELDQLTPPEKPVPTSVDSQAERGESAGDSKPDLSGSLPAPA